MSMFTGLLPSTSGIYANEDFWEKDQRPKTFFECFRDAGYKLFGAGKIFHGVFDYKSATAENLRHASWRKIFHRDAIWDLYQSFKQEPLPSNRPMNGMFDYSDFESVSPWNYLFDWGPLPNEIESEMPDSKSVKFLSDILVKHHDAPFFCALGLYKPHLPWHVPKKYFDRLESRTPSLPLVKHDDLDDAPPIPVDWVLSKNDHKTILENEQWHAAVRGYLASCTFCDAKVGEILSALENSPHADNTIVVFLSDNGFHLGEKLHWRKFVLWEEATQVPLVFYSKSNLVGKGVCAGAVSLIDVGPTLFQLSGLNHEGFEDGVSLFPSLAEPDEFTRSHPVISTWHRGNHSVRSNAWRYTRYSDDTEELFDHRIDQREWTNLAGNINYAPIIEKLRHFIPSSDQSVEHN